MAWLSNAMAAAAVASQQQGTPQSVSLSQAHCRPVLLCTVCQLQLGARTWAAMPRLQVPRKG